MNKPSFICFAQYRIGGVQTFYQNLLEGDKSDVFEKEIIFYDKQDEPTPKFLEGWTASPYKIFKYTPSTEEEYIYRNRLANLLRKKRGVIITNFSLELKSITKNIFKKNTIFHITHDDDYLNIATQYCDRIDAFIAHNPYYAKRLIELMPNRKSDVYYLPYGVDISETKNNINTTKKLRLLFLSRMDKTKGIYNIPKINDYLLKNNIDVDWVIMGNGPERDFITNYIKDYKNFTYFIPKNIQEIHTVAKTCDVYILPSYIDGLPVSMLESMSVGLVPIVFEFNPGITEIIGDAGIVVATNDIENFSKAIIRFDKDRNMLIKYRQATIDLLTKKYDKYKNAKNYFDLFIKYQDLKKNKLRNTSVFSVLQKEEELSIFLKIKKYLFHK